MTLRDRCKAFIDQARRDAILRLGSPVDDLIAFVIAETGRTGSDALKDTLPLCLYFATKADRDEFVALFHEFKPNVIAKKLP